MNRTAAARACKLPGSLSHIICVAAMGLSVSGIVFGQVPERTWAGQTLEVPESWMDSGQVYYASSGRDAQIVIESEALLARTLVIGNRVAGFLVSPFDLEGADEEGFSPVLAGGLRIAVQTLETGSDSENRRLRSARFLDWENHPEITLEMLGASGIRMIEATQEQTRFRLLLKARLNIKEHSRDLELPVELNFMPFSLRSMKRNVGDLVSMQTEFELRLSDFGITPGAQAGDLVSEKVTVDLFLMFNTLSPERSGDPREAPGLQGKRLRFLTLLRDLARVEEAQAYAREFLKEQWDDPGQLRWLADAILDEEAGRGLDVRLAAWAAVRCAELLPRDPAAHATLARVRYRMGLLALAVSSQKKAVELSSGSEKARARKRLIRFRKALEAETPA